VLPRSAPKSHPAQTTAQNARRGAGNLRRTPHQRHCKRKTLRTKACLTVSLYYSRVNRKWNQEKRKIQKLEGHKNQIRRLRPDPAEENTGKIRQILQNEGLVGKTSENLKNDVHFIGYRYYMLKQCEHLPDGGHYTKRIFNPS